MKSTISTILFGLMIMTACNRLSDRQFRVVKLEYRVWTEVQGNPEVCWITARRGSITVVARSMNDDLSCYVELGDAVTKLGDYLGGHLNTKGGYDDLYKIEKEFVN